MAFNPPPLPGYDEEYHYGNITWKFDGTAGVWNIVDGSLVGERGPQGVPGPKGDTGATGNTGSPSTGDSASIIVSNGFITARLGGFGITGVLGLTGRFGIVDGIVSLLPASVGASGIASFNSNDFTVSQTGHVSLANVISGTNTGVTSFNGLTGAVTLTGDGGAIIGEANNIIGARLVDDSGASGVASFSTNFFDITRAGLVSLKSPYSSIGVTGIRVSQSGEGLTGTITLTAGSSNLTITRNGNTITFDSVGGGGGGSSIVAAAEQVLYSSGNAGTGNNNFLFNGTFATFGGENTQFTITGPIFNIGNNTVVRGGVFYDAAESAPYVDLAASSIQIRAIDGSVQRRKITPSLSPFDVNFDTNGWTDQIGVSESVVVILQSTNGRTGQFASGIMTQSPNTVLCGVTNGVDVFTMMRIKTGPGSTDLIKMAFPIARGMVGGNIADV